MEDNADAAPRALIFDPFAGVSGDMIVAALLDLGLGEAWLEELVAALPLASVAARVERTQRRGIACSRVVFELPRSSAHRHLADVLEIVAAAPIPRTARERAERTFRLLADAEAAVHGTTPERVHFHEVGALDSILDVVVACAAFEALGFERAATRPIAVGRGWIEMEHGRYPLPAPATARLLEGLPIRDAGFEGECTTPTGAALVRVLTDGARPPSELVVRASGFGAGSRDPEDRPNCLRVLACELDAHGVQALWLVQADVDDMTPEYVPAARDALMEAGAADVVTLPIDMKKGRTGQRLEALVESPRLDAVLDALFRHTTTLGARYWSVERSVLARREEVIEWRGQRIRLKHARLRDGSERTKPEYDDVERAARALGLPPQTVRRALEAHEGDEA